MVTTLKEQSVKSVHLDSIVQKVSLQVYVYAETIVVNSEVLPVFTVQWPIVSLLIYM